ncbi:MAG: HEPN domain-containing protein [bacterium]
MKDKTLVDEWFKRAHSNLERAKVGKVAEEILFEDLCFDCQQTVEKSIKALLVQLDIEFEKIHSIAKLLKQLEGAGIKVPEEIKETAELSVYAVDTRYPGDYDPVTAPEYKLALAMAEKVIKWAEELIEQMNQNNEQSFVKK